MAGQCGKKWNEAARTCTDSNDIFVIGDKRTSVNNRVFDSQAMDALMSALSWNAYLIVP